MPSSFTMALKLYNWLIEYSICLNNHCLPVCYSVTEKYTRGI